MLRTELTGLAGVVERNVYLVKRYAWWEVAFFVYTVASSYTIVLIAKGIEATGGRLDVNRVTTVLLIGAVVWAYLRAILEILTETVAWERWEGTIEYTFMAPLARSVHLLGMGIFAVAYGVVRAALLFAVLAFAFHLVMPNADFVGALVVAAVAAVSFIGVGMMTAVLPLISPEKGMQLGFMTQGLLLAVSGVYYDVAVLPAPLRAVARFSPATYTLDGIRSSIIGGTGVGGLWHDLWPLMVIGAVSIPLGLWVFHQGEVHAKRHGKLKRSG
jgi:ABC-2 type transport system permease protein